MADHKIEVNAGLSGLPEADYVKDIAAKKKAQEDFPDIVEEIDPSPAAIGTILTHMNDQIAKRTSLENQLKEIADNIAADRKKITDFMVDKWATQIQGVVGITVGQIHSLAFHTKGETPVTPIPLDMVPVVTSIELNVMGVHILHVVDSKEEMKKIPKGMSRTEAWLQIGGTMPTNMTDLMTNGGKKVGEITAGKLVYELPAGNKGKTAFYILTYISKKTKKSFSYSVVYSAPIT